MNETFFHVAAYYASMTNGSTNAAVAAVNDGVLTLSATNFFQLTQRGRLEKMYSAGVSLTRSRVNVPSFRDVNLPYGGPVNLALAVPSPANLTDWGEFGPTVPFGETISVEHTLGGAAPENQFSLLWFRFGRKPIPGGARYRCLYTATITGSTGAWVAGSMTADQVLPAGKYAVVGMVAIGTNLACARLIFPGTMWRPGVLAQNAVGSIGRPEFVNDSMGVLGTFSSVNQPNLEIFCIGACTAQTVFLDLIKIDNTP